MRNQFKEALRIISPKWARSFIWSIVPKFDTLNTYLLRDAKKFETLPPIDSKFIVRPITWDDKEALIKAHAFRGKQSYKKKVPPRLNSPEWVGLAVFDTSNGEIAYIAWVVTKSIRYIEDFGISLKRNQFLLKDGFCVPTYRHQGLHTRMEQERINFCVSNGASEVFIQIHNSNAKGVKSVLSNGYVLYRQNVIIMWPIFNVYRNLRAFVKNPFIKIVK
jgi:hypothetical protein